MIFRSIEEWEAYYFPNGLPEQPEIFLLEDSDGKDRAAVEG